VLHPRDDGLAIEPRDRDGADDVLVGRAPPDLLPLLAAAALAELFQLPLDLFDVHA
jgi:hypothetical protein